MSHSSPLRAAALALSLCTCLWLSTPLLAAQAPSPYTDVSPGAWYAGAAQHCLQRGLMSGTSDSLFSPDTSMSRAMLATVLHRMAGEPQVGRSAWFSDVPADAWYADAVVWAYYQGILSPAGPNRMAPDDVVTRELLASMLWQYAHRPWAGESAPYDDQSHIGPAFLNAVVWARAVGLMDGVGDNRFAPAEPTNRAQVAAVLMRYDLLLHPELTPPSEPPSSPEPEPLPDLHRNHWSDLEQALGYLPAQAPLDPNPYLSDGFVADPDRWHMHYLHQPYTLGIDVSSHQKEVDWQAVAASGVEFAMIRAGYRGYTLGSLNVDPYFERNIQGALDAGLKVGIYFFSQAVTVAEALEEAAFTLELIRPYPITYPVVFDWERQDKEDSRTRDTGPDAITAAALAFCETVKGAGYTPMMYASPSKVYNTLGDHMPWLSGYPFWLAHYTKGMIPSSYRYRFDMWQYTSSGRVPGIEGNVDMNICLTPWDAP